MKFERDVAIPVSDGLSIQANVFRPDAGGQYPVVMAQGAYGKDVHFADQMPAQFEILTQIYPGISDDGSSGRYLRWEVVDPERWIPHGYVVIQVDSRGTGKSPGYMDPYSPREIQDYYDAIEWAAAQRWSNGKIGLLGVSYLAISQWRVAALQPPHLAAIIPWEGASDHYRDWSYHGGILSNAFIRGWYTNQLLRNQHGNGSAPWRDRETGDRTTGEPMSEDLLAGNRSDYLNDLLRHPLNDAWHIERSPDLSRVTVPVLSAGNWGGPGVHLRGNIEGWMRAGATEKWLSVHVGTHYESFYIPEYVDRQRKFFDHYLKGIDNGWGQEPRVRVVVRHPDRIEERTGDRFPLPGTRMVPFFLGQSGELSSAVSDEGEITFVAGSEGITFSTPPLENEQIFLGFVHAKLRVKSTAEDMDLFAVLRLFDPAGQEVVFTGAHEKAPVSRGWLRASHRELDAERSTPERPYLAHRRVQPLTPGHWYDVTVELWPTSIAVPKGYTLALSLMGRDFEFPSLPGRILHNDPHDRTVPADAQYSIAVGGERASCLMMPAI